MDQHRPDMFYYLMDGLELKLGHLLAEKELGSIDQQEMDRLCFIHDCCVMFLAQQLGNAEKGSEDEQLHRSPR